MEGKATEGREMFMVLFESINYPWKFKLSIKFIIQQVVCGRVDNRCQKSLFRRFVLPYNTLLTGIRRQKVVKLIEARKPCEEGNHYGAFKWRVDDACFWSKEPKPFTENKIGKNSICFCCCSVCSCCLVVVSLFNKNAKGSWHSSTRKDQWWFKNLHEAKLCI